MSVWHVNRSGTRTVAVIVICACLFGCSFSVRRSSSTAKSKPTAKVSFVPRQTHIPGGHAVIPFKFVDNLPMVKVYINGQGLYRFMLDTGSTGLMLSPELVAQINPPVVRVEAVLSMRKGMRNLGYMRHIKLVELGGVKLQDLNAVVVNTNNIPQTSGKVHGVLGLQVFANCRLTIDYLEHQIALEALEKAQPLPIEDSNVLPLKSLVGGLVAVPVTINEKTLWCMIDSGQESAIAIPDKKAAILPLTTSPVRVPGSTSTFYQDRIPNRKARLKDSLFLGCHELLSPIILVQGKKPMIGAELLKHFVVTIDQQAMMIRFMRENSGPIEEPPSVRHHGFYFRRQDGIWVVTGAIQGVKLDKLSLKVGDQITRVNKMPTSQLTNTQLQTMVDKNSTLMLNIIRDRQKISIETPVTVLVP